MITSPQRTGFVLSSLAVKITAAILAIMLGLGTFIYFTVESVISSNLHDQHVHKGVSIAGNLAHNAVDPILIENLSRLQLLIKNAQNSDPEIQYIFVIDPKGNVLGHTLPGGFPADLKKLNRELGSEPFSSQLIETERGILLHISVPILHGAVGQLHVGLGRAFLEQHRSAALYQVLAILITACVAGLVLTLLFSRYVTKPLAILADGTEHIRHGDLAHRVRVSGNDEISIVSSAFNRMAESLEKDTAQRLAAEKALKESEELYRSLVENINIGITLVNRDHTIVMANPAQGRIFKRAPEDFVGRKCFRVYGDKDLVCEYCPGDAAMRDGEPKEKITTVEHEDGTSVTLHIRTFPLQDAKGESRGFIEVVDDITETLKTQLELAAEKERLAVTLRSIGDGVITTDISGNIILLNRVAEKLTGWRSEEAVGRPFDEVFHIINEQTRTVCENPVTRVVETGQIIGLDNQTVLVSKDGSELNIADSGAPILDDESNIIGVVLVFRDVTEHLKMEHELLKVKKLESIGVLAGGIAHDFNNILSGVLGNINLSLLDNTLTPKTKGLLSNAEKATLRAKGLTQQLLTFAKGGEPMREISSLEKVVRDSAGFVLHGDKVACQYNISDDLWLVDIDRGQISQVIQNIVLNASHAMPEGGFVTITCENVSSVDAELKALKLEGRYVKLSIHDTGIGMPANVVEKIFDPYFTTKQEGSGLGLAITQSIIKRHKGYVFAESTPGAGTVFSIYLPASTETTFQQDQYAEPVSPAPGNSPVHILIMDDDDMVRTVAAEMLSKLGHTVSAVPDGAEAVQLYEKNLHAGNRFDLVIMDLTIPGGMGGKEAVQEILRVDPDAKVVVSSGYSNNPIMANFKDYGFCAVMIKPYQLQDLSAMINQISG